MAKIVDRPETEARGCVDVELADLDLEQIAGGVGGTGGLAKPGTTTAPSRRQRQWRSISGSSRSTGGSSGRATGRWSTIRPSTYTTGPARSSLQGAAASRIGIR